jgi:hypothetical protein
MSDTDLSIMMVGHGVMCFICFLYTLAQDAIYEIPFVRDCLLLKEGVVPFVLAWYLVLGSLSGVVLAYCLI